MNEMRFYLGGYHGHVWESILNEQGMFIPSRSATYALLFV